MNDHRPPTPPSTATSDTAAIGSITSPVSVLVVSVLLERGSRQYRQTFFAPVNPDPIRFPYDDEVEWLKGYFRMPGYLLDGHYVTNRDAWMIETTTTQAVEAPVQYGPIGAPHRLNDLNDELSRGTFAGNDSNADAAADIDEETAEETAEEIDLDGRDDDEGGNG